MFMSVFVFCLLVTIDGSSVRVFKPTTSNLSDRYYWQVFHVSIVFFFPRCPLVRVGKILLTCHWLRAPWRADARWGRFLSLNKLWRCQTSLDQYKSQMYTLCRIDYSICITWLLRPSHWQGTLFCVLKCFNKLCRRHIVVSFMSFTVERKLMSWAQTDPEFSSSDANKFRGENMVRTLF